MNRHWTLSAIYLILFLAPGFAAAQEQSTIEAISKIAELGGRAQKISSDDESIEVAFHLSALPVTDASLAPLNNLPNLIWLNLSGTKITDEGLRHLATIKTLQKLHLEKTSISDAGLEHLLSLDSLEYLNLYGTKVSDSGILKLASLKNLKKLYVWQSQVTEDGMKRFQEAHPGCQIVGEVKLVPVPPMEKPADPATNGEKPGEAKPGDAPAPTDKSGNEKPADDKSAIDAAKRGQSN